MTTVSVTIDATDVSSKVKRIDVYPKGTEGVGRYQLLLHNPNGIYSGVFTQDAVVTVTVDGAVLFIGYAEQIKPMVLDSPQAHFEQLIQITGRHVGQDLLAKLYDDVYYGKADDIIADELANSGSDITFTSPHTAPTIYHDVKGAFHVDDFREILELINYGGFVNNSKVWNMFPIGSVDSGITLKSVAGAGDNNILKIIEHTEKDIWECRNYIIVFGDEVKDGYTEANADGWAAYYAGNVISDFYGTDPTTPRVGIGAIKIAKGTASYAGGKLTFPRYNHDYVDFSKKVASEVSFQLYQHYPSSPVGVTSAAVFVRFKDNVGNIIEYVTTKGMLLNKWDILTLPAGTPIEIGSSTCFDKWYYISGSSFNWKVVEIDAYSFTGAVQYLLVDALALPIQMIAVADYTSGGRVKQLSLNKRDMNCQKELDAYADSMAQKRKDPIERLHLYARGDIGLIVGVWKWLPEYKVTVNVPAENLNSAAFRYIEIHHIIVEAVTDETSGFDHVVELLMIPATAKLDTQRWSYGEHGERAIIRGLRDRLRYFEQKEIEVRDWYPALPKPFWDLYGRVPPEGLELAEDAVLNPSFEIDSNGDNIPDSWEPLEEYGSGISFSRNSASPIEGKYAAQITCTSGSQCGMYRSKDFIPLQPGRTYFQGCYLRAANAIYGLLVARIYWFKIDKTASATPYVDIYFDSPFTSWTAKIGIVIAPADAYYGKLAFIMASYLGTPGGNTLYIDGTKFQKQLFAPEQFGTGAIAASNLGVKIGTRDAVASRDERPGETSVYVYSVGCVPPSSYYSLGAIEYATDPDVAHRILKVSVDAYISNGAIGTGYLRADIQEDYEHVAYYNGPNVNNASWSRKSWSFVHEAAKGKSVQIYIQYRICNVVAGDNTLYVRNAACEEKSANTYRKELP